MATDSKASQLLTPEPRSPEEVSGAKFQPKLGTGLQIWHGTVDEEYLTDLKPWSRAYKIYSEMRDSAVIGGLLEAIKTPLLSAQFEVRPAGPSRQELEDADFLRCQTIDGLPDMDWREHVEEMLDFVDFGFALSEKVLYKHPDGSLRLRALIPVGQDTLDRWGDPDDFGRVTSFVQRILTSSWASGSKLGSIREAPIDKLLHFTWRPKKRNPMGSPILRSLYRAWYFVKNLEAIEAIGAERDIGGAPVAELGEGFYTQTQIQGLEAALKGLRMDESLYIILPNGIKLTPFSSGAKVYDVRAMIRDYQHLIRQRFFADFLSLGSEEVGTQSLAKEMTTFFGTALRSIQMRMVEVWNHQLVPWIFKWNGRDLESKQLPKIVWTSPARHSLQSLAQTLTTLVNGKLLLRDFNLDNMVRVELGLPELSEEQKVEIEREGAGDQESDTNQSGDDTGVRDRGLGDSEEGFSHPLPSPFLGRPNEAQIVWLQTPVGIRAKELGNIPYWGRSPDEEKEFQRLRRIYSEQGRTRSEVEAMRTQDRADDKLDREAGEEEEEEREGRKPPESFAEVDLVLREKNFGVRGWLDYLYRIVPAKNKFGYAGFLDISILGSVGRIKAVMIDPKYQGVDTVKSLLRAFRAKHPEVRQFEGFRISGSRAKNPQETAVRFLQEASAQGIETIEIGGV